MYTLNKSSKWYIVYIAGYFKKVYLWVNSTHSLTKSAKLRQTTSFLQHRDYDRSTCLDMSEWFQLDFVHLFSPIQYDTNRISYSFLSVTLKDMSILKVTT